MSMIALLFFFSSRRRHTRSLCDWSSDCALPISRPSTKRRSNGRSVSSSCWHDEPTMRFSLFALLPESATADARRLLVTRAARGFADGIVSVLLASWLRQLGFTPFQIGAIVTATLLGSALVTLGVGLLGHRLRRRAVLLGAAGLMVATGLGFAGVTSFWPLLAIAFVGTVNPSAGDVTLFLPTEQAVLAETSDARDRTGLFAWYNLTGTFAGAAGALAAGFPDAAAHWFHVDVAQAERAGFLLYSVFGLVAAAAYARLSPAVEHDTSAPARPLSRSRGIVLKLSALFSLDSFGGGFVVQSLLVLWLFRRFA